LLIQRVSPDDIVVGFAALEELNRTEETNQTMSKVQVGLLKCSREMLLIHLDIIFTTGYFEIIRNTIVHMQGGHMA
jgi:hypothetical protein